MLRASRMEFTREKEAAMTVSMRVMSAGDGYKYLLRTVAAGDGDRSRSTPLTRYYAEDGNPPGRWLGSGLPAFGEGRISGGHDQRVKISPPRRLHERIRPPPRKNIATNDFQRKIDISNSLSYSGTHALPAKSHVLTHVLPTV